MSRVRKFLAATTIGLGLLAGSVAVSPASAADNPYQRGPDPTAASIAAVTGPFATASVTVPRGNGFGGGVIYYPTDTSQGTFGGIAISPGLNGTWPGIAWLGPRLASQGFVVFGIETNNLNDSPTSRGTQLLAALDYLTGSSSVRTRVDAGRLAVAGHSMGGGGALDAALRRPSLRATIGNAPHLPSGSLANDRVPTLIYAMQNDTLVPPSRLTSLYNTVPATTERGYLEITGAGHNYIGQPSTILARTMIPWLKIFVDDDARYSQFLCPLTDRSGISQYQSSCPLITTSPTTGPTAQPTTAAPTTTPTTPPVGGPCEATHRTVNSWSGGYQGEVTVRAGSAAINGWTVSWTLGSGQTINQVWGGALTASGTAATVRNETWNGPVAAGASTTFGYIATGNAPTQPLACSAR
ncbi:poly(ethylene terephthalate) hydrolase family protein [Paractinoplanes rishiriensis]|nr:cellulose binding domain-containing protein [Actinoplanes rishiriensis]